MKGKWRENEASWKGSRNENQTVNWAFEKRLLIALCCQMHCLNLYNAFNCREGCDTWIEAS